jgi:hypothetical protein
MEQTTEYIKNFSSWREERAKAILKKGNPESIDEFTYLVEMFNYLEYKNKIEYSRKGKIKLITLNQGIKT